MLHHVGERPSASKGRGSLAQQEEGYARDARVHTSSRIVASIPGEAVISL